MQSRLRLPRRQLLKIASASPILCLPNWLHAQPIAQPTPIPTPTLVPSPFAHVSPRELQFPRDHGAHPDYRTEWWYLTGLLTAQGGAAFGFQCTFFRSSTGLARSVQRQSTFTPSELVMAHFAVTQISENVKESLTHIQRISRVDSIKNSRIAYASRETTDVGIRDWYLRLTPAGYELQARDAALSMRLTAKPSQPIMLQGERGFSRKGPLPNQASHYYSQPQLQVAGEIAIGSSKSVSVTGNGWLDHEWSTEVMSGDATGWDWLGMNLDDGGALMAFRMRGKDGQAIWSAATFRSKAGEMIALSAEQVTISPQGQWRSNKSGASYPAQLQLTLNHPRLRRSLQLVPLKPDQEVDARATTATIYWEGASELRENGKRVGAGYLEMTGYWKPIQF